MHPVENLRGSASRHLEGRRIVLAVSGSIGAVRCVELARELARHGAQVHAVMSPAASAIVTPAALEFATGNPVVTKLTGAVEHVALLGDVPEKADLLLVAPATANTVGKMALGIDDTPVTTCATVAFGTRTPVVVAPAMHEAMLDHPVVGRHARTLIEELGVTWVEPRHEEKKAKLADVEAIVAAVIHRLANDARRPGPLAGRSVLVVGGATAEPVDPVRVLTNRSSGRSAVLLAQELYRLGASVRLWYGQATYPVPTWLLDQTTTFSSHQSLLDLANSVAAGDFHQVWMPVAVNDYAPEAQPEKIKSGQEGLSIPLRPLGKIIEVLRGRVPDAVLVAFKAESDAASLLERARGRLLRYGSQFIVANSSDAFGSTDTELWLLGQGGMEERFAGSKEEVLASVARRVAETPPDQTRQVDA